MSEDVLQMKPIWYFVGLILIIIGVIVLLAGLYYLFEPINFHIELSGLHTSIWWGVVLIIGGCLLSFLNRKPRDL